MRHVFPVLLLVAIACSDGSGPKGLDPTVKMDNGTGDGPLTLVWWDQSGQTQTFVASPHSTACAKFISTTPADSVRFLAFAGDTTGTNGAWSMRWSFWFDPATGITASELGRTNGGEYWVLQMLTYPEFTMAPVADPPC